jgi:hypothetical protein
MSAKRELVTNSIVPRIKAVLTAAEQTAALVAEEAESEAGRRTSELLAVADADAERIRREATRRVEEYLAASRRRIDAFATARIERITELTEGVIEAAASIQERFEQAATIQREVHTMVEALGTVAAAVASEAAQASPTLPRGPSAPSSREGGPSWARTGPDGAVVGESHSNGRTRHAAIEEDPEPGPDGGELDAGDGHEIRAAEFDDHGESDFDDDSELDFDDGGELNFDGASDFEDGHTATLGESVGTGGEDDGAMASA